MSKSLQHGSRKTFWGTSGSQEILTEKEMEKTWGAILWKMKRIFPGQGALDPPLPTTHSHAKDPARSQEGGLRDACSFRIIRGAWRPGLCVMAACCPPRAGASCITRAALVGLALLNHFPRSPPFSVSSRSPSLIHWLQEIRDKSLPLAKRRKQKT